METPEQPSRAQRAAQGAGALCRKGMGRGWGKLGTCPGPSGCPQPGAGGAVGPGWSGARLRPRLLTHSAAEHPWKAAAPPRCLAAGCQGTLGASTCGDRAGDKAPQKGWWRGGEGARPRGARSRRLRRFAAAENGAGLGGERDGKVAPVPKEAAAPFSARFPMELEGGRALASVSSPSPSPGCHRGAGILEVPGSPSLPAEPFGHRPLVLLPAFPLPDVWAKKFFRLWPKKKRFKPQTSDGDA